MIKRNLFFIGVVAVAAALSGAGAFEARAATEGKIRAATEGAFAPFNFFKGKELTGFEVDLANEIFKKLQLKAEWQALAFDSLLIGLSQDRYDMVIASHAITDERAKAVDFASPHYCSGAVILAHAGGPKTKNDLRGKTVSAQIGTIYVPMLEKIPGIGKVKTFQKDSDSLQALAAGKTDAMVVDRFAALELMKANPKAKLQIGDSVSQERVGMAVKKGNQALVAQLNQGLATVLKDGTYAKLSKKYFDMDVRCK